MGFLQAAPLFLTGMLGLCLFFWVSDKEYAVFQNHKKGVFYGAGACVLLLAGCLLLNLLRPELFAKVRHLTGVCFICGLLFFLAAFFWDKRGKRPPFLRFALRAGVLAILLELFVFNFNAYRLLPEKYVRSVQSPAATSFTETADGYTVAGGAAYMEFTQIDRPVGSIRIDAVSSKNAAVGVTVEYADETNRGYRVGTDNATIIRGNAKSGVLPCSYSGRVSGLRLHVAAGEGESITVRAVVLNEPAPLVFSFVRFFVLFGGAVTVYLFFVGAQLRKPYRENRSVCRGAAIGVALLMVFAAFGLTQLYRGQSGETLRREFSATSGNQITQELVDAFEKGRVSLDIEPGEGLAALDNPYDWSQRTDAGVSYAWDHVYFEGQYYSYYGIAPVVLLFLPYHLLTGYYFPTVWAVFLFGAIGLIFLVKTVLVFIEKFFPDIPSSFAIMALVMAPVVSGVWFNFITPNFYEIAQTAGFACVNAGAFFLLSSNVAGEGAVRRGRVALAGVLLSLAVLCRPTLAVYCVAAVAFLARGLCKLRGRAGEGGKPGGFRRRYGGYLLCAALPFVVIGGAQMLYNYARFGSVLDFGIDYSLTINDFTRAEHHPHLAAIGFFNFLLAFPRVDAAFPFVHSAFSTLHLNGYYFIANTTAVGLFFRALPMFAYAAAPRAYRLVPRDKRRGAAALVGLSCVAAPLVIIYSIWESGYGVRYCTDFSWQLLLGAFAVAFTVYAHTDNAGVKRVLSRMMAVSFLLCIAVNFAMVYEYQLGALAGDAAGKEGLLSLARAFEFWR